MSRALYWLGHGSPTWVEAVTSPEVGQVLLHATHTLFELQPTALALTSVARVQESAAGTSLQRQARVVVRGPDPSNVFQVLARRCTPIVESTDAAAAAILPLLAEVLCALRRAAPDLGTSVIVSGSDLRAELLLCILARGGTRSVASLRATDAPEPVTKLGEVLRSTPGDVSPTLVAHLEQLRPPILVLDTTSTRSIIQSHLVSLPNRSSLVLLGGSVSGAAAVDFYRDVHRKNLRLFGTSPASVTEADSLRASRLLETKRIAPEDFRFEKVEAAAGRVPPTAGQRWVLLHWDTQSTANQPEN